MNNKAVLAVGEIQSAASLAAVENEVPDYLARDLREGADIMHGAVQNVIELLIGDSEYTASERGQRGISILELYEERLRARQLVSEAEEARDQAQEAAGAADQAAGKAGDEGLAEHFSRYARREQRSANWLRGFTALVLLCITALATALLLRETSAHVSTLEELTKLSLTLPLVALAAYLAREAGHHRAAGTWAAEFEVQLRTLDAFTRPLSDELRNAIRADLGRRVFTTQRPSLPIASIAPNAVTDAASLVEKVSDLVKSTSNAKGDAGK